LFSFFTFALNTGPILVKSGGLYDVFDLLDLVYCCCEEVSGRPPR